jgi:mannose-6-phosphate isomerase-like protein (cupin superfamily)
MSTFNFSNPEDKDNVFSQVSKYLEEKGLIIINEDLKRPWGGFYVISENQIEQFIQAFFSQISISSDEMMLRMSPKILMVAPHARLSWQYHHRRSEIWRIIDGPVAVNTSDTDKPGVEQTYEQNAIVNITQGTRHRLIGLETWGVVAEIWKHTDSNNPSNEEDIIRVQDDFGR